MMIFRTSLFFLLFFLVSLFNLSSAEPLDPLPVEKAFALNAQIESKTGEIILDWNIAPDHYLYQDKIKAYDTSANKKNLALSLPPATTLPDPILGDQHVYEHHLRVKIPHTDYPAAPSTLTIQYQGCSAAGFCYPPQKFFYQVEKKNGKFTLAPLSSIVATDINTLPTSISGAHADGDSDSLHESAIQALKQANMPTQLALFYLIGLLLAFTPCVLPMLPILASVIITEDKLSTLKGLILSLSYVFSMATTYALAGILAAKLGQSVQVFFQNIWVMGIFSLFFVYLGLVQLEKLPLKLPSKLREKFHQLHHKQNGGHILGAIILGFLGTLIASPCVTAPLVATLSYISQTGNEIIGGTSLFMMGLGMGTPMVILGTLGGRFIPKAGKWMQLVNELFAIMLFGLAIWIVKSVLPPTLTMTLWGILALIAGYFMGFFNKRKYRYLPKIGMVIFIYGLILILGALSGHTHPLKPLEFLNTSKDQGKLNSSHPNFSKFITVTELAGLNSELKKHPNKKILIKFYADWCTSCKHLDITLFQDPEVIQDLKNWVLIKADITENAAAQRELMKAYQVFAPPSLYLFKNNHPNSYIQFHGEISKSEFLSELNNF